MAGDVVDQSGEEVSPKLETIAGREGFIVASNLLENKGIKTDFRVILMRRLLSRAVLLARVAPFRLNLCLKPTS